MLPILGPAASILTNTIPAITTAAATSIPAATATSPGFLASLGSGIGSLMFGSAGGGAGLFGQGGQFNLGQTAMTAGMGLGVASAFQGGSQSTARVKLSPMGEKVKSKLYEAGGKMYEGTLMPKNLASQYIGQIKRAGGEAKREEEKMMTQMSARPGAGRFGLQAALASAGEGVERAAAPTKWRQQQRGAEWSEGKALLSNLFNIEKQIGMQQTQAGMTESLLRQMKGAQKGQAIGDLARYVSMLRYPV